MIEISPEIMFQFTCKDGFGTSAGLTNAGTKTCSGTIKSYVDLVKCYRESDLDVFYNV